MLNNRAKYIPIFIIKLLHRFAHFATNSPPLFLLLLVFFFLYLNLIQFMNAAIAAFNPYTGIAITHYTTKTKYSIPTHIRRNSLMRESSLETQLKGFISFSNAVPLDCTPSMRPSILKNVPTYCMIPMLLLGIFFDSLQSRYFSWFLAAWGSSGVGNDAGCWILPRAKAISKHYPYLMGVLGQI